MRARWLLLPTSDTAEDDGKLLLPLLPLTSRDSNALYATGGALSQPARTQKAGEGCPTTVRNDAAPAARKSKRDASAAELETQPAVALAVTSPAKRHHHQDPPDLFSENEADVVFDDYDKFRDECGKFKSKPRPAGAKRCGPCCRCGKKSTPQWRNCPFKKDGEDADLCNTCGAQLIVKNKWKDKAAAQHPHKAAERGYNV